MIKNARTKIKNKELINKTVNLNNNKNKKKNDIEIENNIKKSEAMRVGELNMGEIPKGRESRCDDVIKPIGNSKFNKISSRTTIRLTGPHFQVDTNKNLKKNNLIKKGVSLTKMHKKIANINTKNNTRLAFIFKLLLVFLSFHLIEGKLRQLNNINEISMIIKGTGNYQNILSGEIYKPDEVIINEEKMELLGFTYKLDNPENRIIIRYNKSLTTCKNMFYNIKQLLSIDFSNFDSSKLNDTSSMFTECKNLKSINFHNFNTSLLKTMKYMFDKCLSLTSLDLSSFDTSLVTSMKNMFHNCTSLETLDISSFNTKSLEILDEMFHNAESLV